MYKIKPEIKSFHLEPSIKAMEAYNALIDKSILLGQPNQLKIPQGYREVTVDDKTIYGIIFDNSVLSGESPFFPIASEVTNPCLVYYPTTAGEYISIDLIDFQRNTSHATPVVISDEGIFFNINNLTSVYGVCAKSSSDEVLEALTKFTLSEATRNTFKQYLDNFNFTVVGNKVVHNLLAWELNKSCVTKSSVQFDGDLEATIYSQYQQAILSIEIDNDTPNGAYFDKDSCCLVVTQDSYTLRISMYDKAHLFSKFPNVQNQPTYVNFVRADSTVLGIEKQCVPSLSFDDTRYYFVSHVYDPQMNIIPSTQLTGFTDRMYNGTGSDAAYFPMLKDESYTTETAEYLVNNTNLFNDWSDAGNLYRGKVNIAPYLLNPVVIDNYTKESKQISKYVVSALAGNAWVESHVNPSVRQLGGFAYGLFQWDGSRESQLQKWLKVYGDKGDSQLSFLIVEDVWNGEFGGITSLYDFLFSDSTDVEMLTEAFCTCWELPGKAKLEERISFAKQALEYLNLHSNEHTYNWRTEPSHYLSNDDALYNTVKMYQYLTSPNVPIKYSSTTSEIPGSGESGDTPGTTGGDDTPGSGESGDTPGTTGGDDTPGSGESGDTPGTQSDDTPGSGGSEGIPGSGLISSKATALYTVYNPKLRTFNDFGMWLWSPFDEDVLDLFKKQFEHPIDSILDAFELFVKPQNGSLAEIRTGGIGSDVQAPLVEIRELSYNCGEIEIPRYYNSFLDFAPYTTVKIYLPFIGMQELPTNVVMGKKVRLSYRVDCYTGDCAASVYCNGMLIGIYSGNCSRKMPITSRTSNTLMNLTNSLLTVAGGIITSNPIAAAGGIAQGAFGNSAQTMVSGGLSGNSGSLLPLTPMIQIMRVKIASQTANSGHTVSGQHTLGSRRGLVKVREIVNISAQLTTKEYNKIVEVIKEGVIIREG